MVKKTIPQLQETTTVTDSSYFVVDNGSTTKKISKVNLQKSFTKKTRHQSITSETMTADDDTVIFDSPNSPAGMDAYLPAVTGLSGKEIKIHNNGTGKLQILPTGVGVKINGAAFLNMDGLNMAHTLVCDGANWFIFS